MCRGGEGGGGGGGGGGEREREREREIIPDIKTILGRGRPDSALNQDQREQKIVTIPGLLEYYSFMFNFHSFLAGPICTVKEYMAFMDGSNFGASPQQSTKVC